MSIFQKVSGSIFGSPFGSPFGNDEGIPKAGLLAYFRNSIDTVGLSISLWTPPAVSGTSYYCDTALATSGDGSLQAPFNNLNDAFAALLTGDALFFLPGVHVDIGGGRGIGSVGVKITSLLDNPLNTIIDFDNTASFWSFGNHTGETLVHSLMFTRSQHSTAGAIQISSNEADEVIIKNNIFKDNKRQLNTGAAVSAKILGNKFLGVTSGDRHMYLQPYAAGDYGIHINNNIFGPSENYLSACALYIRSSLDSAVTIEFNNNIILGTRGINPIYAYKTGSVDPTINGKNNIIFTGYQESMASTPVIGGNATGNSTFDKTVVLGPTTSGSKFESSVGGVTVSDTIITESGITRYPRKGFLTLGIDDTLAYIGEGDMKTDALIPVLSEYGLKMTWFVTAASVDNEAKAAIKRWLDAGHEVGLHGLNHTSLCATVGLVGVLKAGESITISINDSSENVQDWTGTVTIDGGSSVIVDGNTNDSANISKLSELKTWLEGEGCTVTGYPEYFSGGVLAVSLADQTSLSIDGSADLPISAARYQTAEIIYGKYVLESGVRSIEGYADYICYTGSAPFNDNNATGMDIIKTSGLVLFRSDDNADIGFVNMYGVSEEYPLSIYSIGDCIFSQEDTWFGALVDSATGTVTPEKAYGHLVWLANQGAISALYVHRDSGPMSYLTDLLDIAANLVSRGNLMVGSHKEIADYIRGNGTMIEGDGTGSQEQWYLDFEENYGDYTLRSDSACIGTGIDPYVDGDGDQYDAYGYKVWDDGYNLPDGHWIDGVDIGPYAYGGASKYYPKLSNPSEGVWVWESAPDILDIVGVGNAVYNADGTGIEFATEALAFAAFVGLADDVQIFAGDTQIAIYSTDQSAKADLINRRLK